MFQLSESVYYNYKSQDGKSKVVITFTAQSFKNYKNVFQVADYPVLLFDIEEYENVDDVPTENVPAIILASSDVKTEVEKCAHYTTPMPTEYTTYQPSTGPTICYEDIFTHSDIPSYTAENANPDSPKLFELSPNSGKEQIIDVELTSGSEEPSETTTTDVTPVTAVYSSDGNAPELFEVSPNVAKEDIVDVTTTEGTTSSVLTPSDALKTVSKFIILLTKILSLSIIIGDIFLHDHL